MKTHFEQFAESSSIYKDIEEVLYDPAIDPDGHGSYGIASRVSKKYEAFGHYVERNLLRAGIPPHEIKSTVSAIIVQSYHMFMHDHHGRRVYRVSQGLAEQLWYTDLRGLDSKDILLPFKNIYLQTEDIPFFKVFNKQSGWHQVIGIYLSEDIHAHHGWYDKMGKAMKAATPTYSKKMIHELHFMIVGENKSVKNLMDDALYYFTLTMDDGENLDDALKKFMATKDEMNDVGKDIIKWVCNVIMYATSSEPSEKIMENKEARKLWDRIAKLPKSTKRTKLVQRAKDIPKQERVILGGNIVVSRNSPLYESDGNANSHKMNVRCKVAGHWRHYWIGEGRTQRVRKRIEPFWRGPDTAPVVAKRHVLKAK